MQAASLRISPDRSQITPAQATFLEHIQELRMRLLWVAGAVVAASLLGYAGKDQLVQLLLLPLGEHKLYYLTPLGGFGFLLRTCFYFGLVASLPVAMHQFYRYMQPLMGHKRLPVVLYGCFSGLLAVLGILFAYFVSLPAALHFLTAFTVADVTAMLTADAYLTFVMSYLLGAALLFQIPLVLLIINRITPLKPQILMKYQRHVIVAAFIGGAIISPTPDIMNQLLVALPIIVMYQAGIGAVWVAGRKNRSVGALMRSDLPINAMQQANLVEDKRLRSSGWRQANGPQTLRAKSRLISDFRPYVSDHRAALNQSACPAGALSRPKTGVIDGILKRVARS